MVRESINKKLLRVALKYKSLSLIVIFGRVKRKIEDVDKPLLNVLLYVPLTRCWIRQQTKQVN